MLLWALICSLLLISLAEAEECVNSLKWSTSRGQILVNGQPLVLKGVNYFGFNTNTFYPHGMWAYDLNYYLDFIKNNTFNAIRVPISMEMIKRNPSNLTINCWTNGELCKKSAIEVLDAFIDRSAERGLLIMLDNHVITEKGGISSLWYNDEYPETLVISLWKSLVTRYSNRWNVFAIDLKNEPHSSATWGNSSTSTDWNKAAERMINGLSSFPGLFFVEGIDWGTRLENVAQFPINTGNSALNNRVVYSPHCYGPDVYSPPEFNDPTFPKNLDPIWMAKYGYVVNKTGQPVVVGEWGGKAAVGSKDETWNKYYIEWLRNNCLTNNFYWCLNPDSGDTGGLLEDDWLTPIPRKIAFTTRIQPNPTTFKARDGKICITPGTFPEERCRAGGQPIPQPTTTTTTTLRPTTTPASKDGVTATVVVEKEWQESGKTVKKCILKISNGSSSKVCGVQVKLTLTKDVWTLEKVSTDLYKTPSWMTIAPGAANDQINYIAFGDSTITIDAVQKC